MQPFHCIGTELFNFSEHREIARYPDIFLEKGSVTASLQQPRRCYGALVAFFLIPTEFLSAILCALTILSLSFHGAHHACKCTFPAFALRFHGVCTALTACRWQSDISKVKKYAKIRNCSNQNPNPALKPKREIITNTQNTKRTYGQLSEQLFPNRWPLSNRNQTKIIQMHIR